MEQEIDQDYEKRLNAFFDKYPDCPDTETLESINLITSKDNAVNIIKGAKHIEFRDNTPFYRIQLVNKDLLDYINLMADRNNQDFLDSYPEFVSTIVAVDKIHFCDYNKTWYLDVSVKGNFFLSPDKDSIDWIHENYGSTDLDSIFESVESQIKSGYITEGDRPCYFCFLLDEVLGTNLTA